MKWEMKTLNELGFVGRGKSRHRPRNAEHLYGGIYPLIQTGDIQNANFYITKYSQTYSEEGLAQSKLWKEGTLVISIVGANTAETAILGFDACFPDSVIGFIPYEGISDAKFVKYTLECLKNHLKGISEGTARENLSLEKLLSVKTSIPSFPIQRKIASILSAYDDLIENNLKRIKLLEEAMNINYKNLISTEDKNFSNVKLNSFVDIISGFPFKSNYYNENGKYKIVTIKNVQDGFFVPVVTDRIEDIPDNMNKALFLSTGDVIMSLTGNVGRVCLVYGDDYVLNQRVVKLSAKELIDQSFIYALVRDKQMLTILENLSNGTAQQNLSPIKMGELPIKYPSSIYREDFNQKVSPMIEMICKLNTQNTKLREARDILLPKLMNGQIEV
jgi:type I restriction enzyme S subunit